MSLLLVKVTFLDIKSTVQVYSTFYSGLYGIVAVLLSTMPGDLTFK